MQTVKVFFVLNVVLSLLIATPALAIHGSACDNASGPADCPPGQTRFVDGAYYCYNANPKNSRTGGRTVVHTGAIQCEPNAMDNSTYLTTDD